VWTLNEKGGFLSRSLDNEGTAKFSHGLFPASTIKVVHYPPDGTVSACLFSFVSWIRCTDMRFLLPCTFLPPFLLYFLLQFSLFLVSYLTRIDGKSW
jgi:hypothetical protein